MNELIDKLYYIDNIINLIDAHSNWTRKDIRCILKEHYGRKANAYLTFLLQNHYITEECKITDSCRSYVNMLYDLIIELERKDYE